MSAKTETHSGNIAEKQEGEERKQRREEGFLKLRTKRKESLKEKGRTEMMEVERAGKGPVSVSQAVSAWAVDSHYGNHPITSHPSRLHLLASLFK